MMKTLWLVIYFMVLIWSAINPKDTFTWLLEVSPAIIGLIILVATYRRFCLSRFTYVLILIHSVILMIGGHYTYAYVPFFDTLAVWFDWSRNNYDKLGHFVQGFIPAAIAREILLRLNVVNGEGWRKLFIISVCLAFSAFYEMIEWWGSVIIGGEAAEDFLGAQGYIWDTQSDMMFALIGSGLFVLFFQRWQDRSIAKLALSSQTT